MVCTSAPKGCTTCPTFRDIRLGVGGCTCVGRLGSSVQLAPPSATALAPCSGAVARAWSTVLRMLRVLRGIIKDMLLPAPCLSEFLGVLRVCSIPSGPACPASGPNGVTGTLRRAGVTRLITEAGISTVASSKVSTFEQLRFSISVGGRWTAAGAVGGRPLANDWDAFTGCIGWRLDGINCKR